MISVSLHNSVWDVRHESKDDGERNFTIRLKDSSSAAKSQDMMNSNSTILFENKVTVAWDVNAYATRLLTESEFKQMNMNTTREPTMRKLADDLIFWLVYCYCKVVSLKLWQQSKEECDNKSVEFLVHWRKANKGKKT